jgi:hypothetical protein
MPRPYKPWYHPKKKARVIEPGGKVHVLVEGPKNGETERLAREELLLFQARRVEEQRANSPVDQGNPTVVSVVEAFLAHDEKHSAPRTFYERKRYLQLFAEEHGRLPVKDCKAYHKLVQAAGKNRHLVEVLKFMRLTGPG